MKWSPPPSPSQFFKSISFVFPSYILLGKYNSNLPLTRSNFSSPSKKKYLPNFPTQENPGIENFKPKKSFDQPRRLRSHYSPPPPLPVGASTRVPAVTNTYVTSGVVFYDVFPEYLPIIPHSSARTHKFAMSSAGKNCQSFATWR